ncbi:MAG TPA: hypothetical protein VKX49_16385 [Bryobacteraceae bacterium]|nr:hypothetical protein [Bryobacteraceae bacterium]
MKTTVAISILALAAVGLAHDEAEGKPVNISGTVVDTGCYMSHDAIGEKHTDCATMYAKNCVPLAIVDTGRESLHARRGRPQESKRQAPAIR